MGARQQGEEQRDFVIFAVSLEGILSLFLEAQIISGRRQPFGADPRGMRDATRQGVLKLFKLLPADRWFLPGQQLPQAC